MPKRHGSARITGGAEDDPVRVAGECDGSVAYALAAENRDHASGSIARATLRLTPAGGASGTSLNARSDLHGNLLVRPLNSNRRATRS